jgi:hypothetical protein
MKPFPIMFRLVIACLLSGWVLLLGLGLVFWLTGIQQQILGSRGANSFPFEACGQSCIKWACVWGFLSGTSFVFRGLPRMKTSVEPIGGSPVVL